MLHIHKIALGILSSLLFLMGITLYGQNDVHFSYKCSDQIIPPTKASVLLRSPDNQTLNFFSDTVRCYNFSDKNYFKTKGKYTVSVFFQADQIGMDSLDYDFELNGLEIETKISIEFNYKVKQKRKGDNFVNRDKILNCYIQICKYYDSPKSVNIELVKEMTGNDDYLGPVFKIKNHSKDTLYGEHLPGYFWGTLSFIRNDSILSTKPGILDHEFVDSPPLYPDSTKLATVGSFGFTKKLSPFKYRFEVMLADTWQSLGIPIFKESLNFDWWAGTKNIYVLKYDFSVDD